MPGKLNNSNHMPVLICQSQALYVVANIKELKLVYIVYIVRN